VTAQRHEATVHIEPSGLSIRLADGRIVSRAYTQMRQVTATVSDQPLRIEFREGSSEILLIPDRAFIDATRVLAPDSPFRHGKGNPRQTVWLLVLLALAAAVVSTVAVYRWALPKMADLASAKIPVAIEERLGRAVMEGLMENSALCRSEQQTAAVNDIAKALSESAEDSPYHFEVVVLDDPAVNAFSAPGGYIVINRGLLEVTSRPEELAGVLAHEMQHVLQRHVTKSLLRELGLWVTLTTVTGDASALLVQVGRVAGGLQYRREDEEEADREGMALIQRARIDPAGMVDIFQTMANQEGELPGGLEYLSTHPAMDRRVAKLRELMAGAHYEPGSLLAGVDWVLVAQGCKPGGNQ
jgi:predicted Zn-dependent protease